MKERIAKLFLKDGIFQINTKNLFTYSDGSVGVGYSDTRKLISDSQSRKIIIDSFIEIIKDNNLTFDAICGVATGSISWASWLASYFNLPLIYVRQTPKDHGLGNIIEGNIEDIGRVLVIEDVIGSGGSSLNACKSLSEENLHSVACLCILDCSIASASQKYRDAKIPCYGITDQLTLGRVAKDNNYITDSEFEIYMKWIKEYPWRSA